MKKLWNVCGSFFCAAVFLVNAWNFGVAHGLREDSAYYVCLGLIWLAGAGRWTLRGAAAMKRQDGEDQGKEPRDGPARRQ